VVDLTIVVEYVVVRATDGQDLQPFNVG